MGAEAARKLSADGFNVAILSSSGKGEALASELGGVGVTGSNQSNDDLKRLIDEAMQRWGRVDVLVNSAGHGPRAPVLELSDDDWHRGMDVYFLNVVRPTRLVTPIMQKQQSGVIINISTFAAFEPDPVFPTSGVFRAGLATFTKLFSDKYAADNIRMNNVLPRIHRQPPREGRVQTTYPDGPLRKDTGNRRRDCVSGFRRSSLYDRTEHFASTAESRGQSETSFPIVEEDGKLKSQPATKHTEVEQ